jgi:NAD(P)-dependent dehydrogenase (short-subunit alcohol dehydrogenase family)
MKTSIKWDLNNVPDLSGKVIIVTGGNSGLGFHAVKAFANKNAQVIMASRNIKKAEEARQEIHHQIPHAKIDILQLDLTDLESVKNFSVKFKKEYNQLNILLNNAGIMMVPNSKTKDGFEMQLGTNHLGHFALTALLMDVIKSTPKARIVNVSSMAHKMGSIDFSNLQYENGGYSPFKSYCRSKLSNLLFTYELDRYLKANNIDCIALAAHPGVSDTHLFDHIAPKWMMRLLKPLTSLFIQPADMGALPEIRAALDPLAQGADFYGPDGFREMKGYPVKVKSGAKSYNTNDATSLWTYSEITTKLQFQ